MSESTALQPAKPLNINISFNISRKQVTQNINSIEPPTALNLPIPHDLETSPSPKPKPSFQRAPKTPELIYTDRNNIKKEFQFIRPTQEIKRKRKVKRNSGDYLVEKTVQLQPYTNDLEKSFQGHKRGYSTTVAKKSLQETGTKKKKSNTKASDQFFRQNRTVNLHQNQNQSIKFNASKSLKGMISKMINSELSKRSLPLPVVASKSKYSHSASLTSKKGETQKQVKKKGSKSQVLSKDKSINLNKNILIAEDLYENGENRQNGQQLLNRSEILEKLGNFRSVQNSNLFLDAQKLQEQEELQVYSESKLISLFNNKKKVEIRTDQSMECIDQIHELQRRKFQEEFFSQNTEEDYLDLAKNNHTQELLQTYITLLKEQYNETVSKHCPSSDENEPFFEMLGIDARKRATSLSDEETQKNIMQNRQDVVYDENYLNSSDLIRVDDLLMSPSRNNQSSTENGSKNGGTSNTRIPSFMLIEEVVSKQEIEDPYRLSLIKEERQKPEQVYLTKEQILTLRAQSNVSKGVEERSDQVMVSQNQMTRINELKKKEIEKWSYLLEYIKTNSENQMNTQEILSHVQNYLSKAKVDLQKYGSSEMGLKLSQNVQFALKTSEIIVENITPQSQEQEAILNEETRSFKDEYESDNDEDIKFMNLQTIQSAFKSRLQILHSKKVKEILKLQQSLEQQKISIETYKEQKSSILKWFEAQTNEIQSVKKNIWKGYNEAKGILHKSSLAAKIQHQRQFLKHNKEQKVIEPNEKGKLNDLKQRKMMKCLSESYLKKKSINFKQIFQEQQNQLEVEEEQKSQQLETLRRSKYVNDDEEDSEEVYHYESNQLKEETKLPEDKVNDVHENQSKQVQENEPQTQKIDLLTVNQPKTEKSQDFSPTMMHYEEISKNLGEDSLSDEISQQSFKYFPSSHDSENHPYEYEDQKSVEGSNSNSAKNNEPSPESLDSMSESQSPKTPLYINQFCFQEPQKQAPNSPPSAGPIKNKFQSTWESRLKNLTEDDREDIFEFLFLDICIELYQEPCYDNKIMATIHKFMQKQLEMGKRKKGVKTNLNVVKDYLKRFCGYVVRTNKRFLANMNVPMGPTALEMLRYMHENDSEEVIDDSEAVTLIVPITVFDVFERSLLPTLEFERYYDDDAKENQRISFLKNIIHIHNKAIFDALNEYLDQERPFGIWGKPFPWKKSSSFSHEFTEIEQEQKIKKSAQKVVEACSYVCGLLVDKEESLIGNSKVSPAYIEQIREDRISRMLANDMMENEERWVFYDDEETEVMVEITNTIHHRLLSQFIKELLFIKSSRQEEDFFD